MYREPQQYYAGLIAIRRKFAEFRLQYGSEIRALIKFRDLENGAFIAEIGRFVLAVNPHGHDIRIQVTGDVYADKSSASPTPLYHVDGEAMCGRRSVLLVKVK